MISHSLHIVVQFVLQVWRDTMRKIGDGNVIIRTKVTNLTDSLSATFRVISKLHVLHTTSHIIQEKLVV